MVKKISYLSLIILLKIMCIVYEFYLSELFEAWGFLLAFFVGILGDGTGGGQVDMPDDFGRLPRPKGKH